ncbi:MAG: putative membrane protein YkoI [Cyclobacteriaceae bacterium]|jgi:uncharacterized membrane protein YkoI
MKNVTLILGAVLAMASQSCGQKKTTKDVPQAIIKSFTEMFPNAYKVAWEKENEMEWEAEFDQYGKEYSANFANDGSWLETEYELGTSDLPSAVQNTLDSEFSDYEIKEAELSETSEGVKFEFELEKGETEIEVTIHAAGLIISQVSKAENDKD